MLWLLPRNATLSDTPEMCSVAPWFVRNSSGSVLSDARNAGCVRALRSGAMTTREREDDDRRQHRAEKRSRTRMR